MKWEHNELVVVRHNIDQFLKKRNPLFFVKVSVSVGLVNAALNQSEVFVKHRAS